MTKKDRSDWLKAIRIELGLSQKDISGLMGITQSTYSHMEKGEKSNLTIDHMNFLVDEFNVNPYYLLNGEKPMFIEFNHILEKTKSDVMNPYSTNLAGGGTFLVPVSAQAGYAEEWPQEQINLPEVIIPGMKNGDTRVFEISGDSMTPFIMDGDYVACTKVENRHHVRDGLMYVIVSRTQGITVKYLRIQQHTVRCYPANTDGYQPFDLDFDEVRELWEVQIRITKHITAGNFEYQAIGDQSRISRLENVVEKLLELPQFKQK